MKHLYISLFLFLFSVIAKAQERVDITTCEGTGTGIVCVAPRDSLYKLCVKVTPGPCVDKNYTIDWGDGKIEPIVLNSALTLTHEYDLRNFVRSCSTGEYKVSIFVENKTCPNDNKGFRVTFNKNPQAKPAVQMACEGSSVSFINNSCPTSSDIRFLWEFSDGQTSTATYPNVSFTDPDKTYKIKLTATSQTCGTSTNEVDFKMTRRPVPQFKTTGVNILGQDTVVCISGGGIVTMDGTVSTDETNYYWQISGGKYTYEDKTHSSSGTIKVKFEEAKEYTISLVAGNNCGSSKALVRKIKVVNLATLTLVPQADVCEEIKYKIASPLSGAIYTLNGKTVDPNQEITLPLSSSPYIINASLSNACGNQILSDTFTVSAPQPVKILNFPKDTIICLSNTAIPLIANIAGGSWSTQGVETQNGRSFFVPKTAGTYTLTYSRGTGKCLMTDAVTIKVDGIQVTTTDQTICSGTPFTKLLATPSGGTWSTSNCLNCIKGDTLLSGGLTVTQLTLTYETGNQNGCKASATSKITIGQPKAFFDLAAGCAGTFKPTNNSTGAGSYTWLVNGVIASSLANPELKLTSGIQNITLVAKSGNCADTLRKQIKITSAPAPVAFTPSETLGCAPLKTTFLLNGAADNDATYTWSFGNSTSYTGTQPPAQTFQNPDKIDRTYTVTLTSGNTCGQQTFSKDIIVRPFVRAEIGVDSTTLRCTPAQMLFSNRSVGHDKNLSRWIFGDGTSFISANDTLYHTYTAKDSARTYQVKLEISSACGLDTAEISIRVYPTSVKALYTISKSIVCPGESVQFTDATVPKPNRWLWKFGDGTISTLENPTHVFAKSQSEFKVTLLAYTSCGYDSTQLTVKTTAAPSGTFDDVPIACQGSAVQFNNKSDFQLGFIWDFGDGSPLDSANHSPLHIYDRSGNFTASLFLYRGVQSCKILAKKAVVSVVSSPVADFGFRTDSLFCAPGPVSLINRSENADAYQWTFSDGRTTDAASPSLPFDEGLYHVKLIATKGGVCKDSVERMAAFVVRRCEVNIPEAFTPNGDGIGDRYTIFGSGILKINALRIRNRWGEMVFEAKNIPSGSQQPGESWDGTFGGKPMPADMYIYEAEILYADNRISEKLRGNIYLVR
ncbi:PKD domain-containing protein [Dyadobacter psychrotolerans]|uniref:PKD domain-containing protein n=1 Tax=Dyadobacter psychrotolerans TaxID=2541721 RepID=A0A4R5DFQ0_9BACT|nr:PKD domain-containing protein [Dyadobacter psychrotolerans]TDE12007.1 PKD domain-containing protein [Dyadobacter psychrotolerans]